MRLLRLTLENWRGVEAREISFAEGITLIEGPNEIGKSTIIEAVQMLFSELDSSNKQQVKAIQPVGVDVGSRVELEVQAGDYHFTYSKVYNKTKQTELKILAPAPKQLTGREAHEEVERMLDESVDMSLWNALLVDQGERVGLVNLQSSAGLARALDEAAGSSGGSNAGAAEDTDLFSAVQAEYEKYFTLKAGRPRFISAQEDLDNTSLVLEEARTALREVETDSATHERTALEVQRLVSTLPALQTKMQEHEQAWRAVGSLQQTIAAKHSELKFARTILQAAAAANAQRLKLLAEIETAEQQLKIESEKLAPLRDQTRLLKDKVSASQQKIGDAVEQAKLARHALDLAQADERYLQDLEQLTRNIARLEQLQEISEQLKSHLQVTTSISVDDNALASFRDAASKLAIALATRDAAATIISITAQQDLEFELDGEGLSLSKGSEKSHTIASELELKLPGVADIRITPSLSVAQLQEQTEEAEAALANLASRYRVTDLKAAIAAHQLRISAQREVDRLKARETDILQDASTQEIRLMIGAQQSTCDQYRAERDSPIEIPGQLTDAATRDIDLRAVLANKEAALETLQDAARVLQEEHTRLDAQLQLSQIDLTGLEAALTHNRTRLDTDRAQSPDATLADHAAQLRDKVEALLGEADTLQASLDETSPDTLEILLTNARDAQVRAAADLNSSRLELAVVSDRLQRAQADGRFETLEAAERRHEEAAGVFESTRRRAAAAQRLWTTLNKHRNATREAYVRPLKEAIERLGAIVFGAGFEVEIDDDWSVISRTLDGKTLPFNALSVGAKEQLGILTRLAAAQIVSNQGGVPLIIDDALGFSDPSRLETMGAAIAAAGKQSQIIILTCTPGRFTHVGSAEVVRM